MTASKRAGEEINPSAKRIKSTDTRQNGSITHSSDAKVNELLLDAKYDRSDIVPISHKLGADVSLYEKLECLYSICNKHVVHHPAKGWMVTIKYENLDQSVEWATQFGLLAMQAGVKFVPNMRFDEGRIYFGDVHNSNDLFNAFSENISAKFNAVSCKNSGLAPVGSEWKKSFVSQITPVVYESFCGALPSKELANLKATDRKRILKIDSLLEKEWKLVNDEYVLEFDTDFKEAKSTYDSYVNACKGLDVTFKMQGMRISISQKDRDGIRQLVQTINNEPHKSKSLRS